MLGVCKTFLNYSTWRGDTQADILGAIRASNTLLADLTDVCVASAQYRQDGCNLQVSVDGGVNWVTIFEQCADDDSSYVATNPLLTARNVITGQADVCELTIKGFLDQSSDFFEVLNHSSDSIFTASEQSVNSYRPFSVHGQFPALNIESTYHTSFLRLCDSDPSSPTRKELTFKLDLVNSRSEIQTIQQGVAFWPLLIQPDGGKTSINTRLASAGFNVGGSSLFDGPVNVNFNKISNLATPVDNLDAATKAYVDSHQAMDGAGITAVTLVEGLPTSAPSATLTENPDIQHQQLDLSIPTPGIVTEVTATALSSGESPTVSVETRTDGDLHLSFGIPSGAQGLPGVLGPYPDLPAIDGDPVEFWLDILANGSFLPWPVPFGYSVILTETSGFWNAVGPNNNYITPGTGSPTFNEFDGIPSGRVVFFAYEYNHTSLETGTNFLLAADAFVEHVADRDQMVALGVNAEPGTTGVGHVLGCVRITPMSSAFEWVIVLDFTLASHDGAGVEQFGTNGGGVWCGHTLRDPGWYSGLGWSSGGSGWNQSLRIGLGGGDASTSVEQVEVRGRILKEPNGTTRCRVHEFYNWNSGYTIDGTNIVTDGTPDIADLPQPQRINGRYQFDVSLSAYDHSTACTPPDTGFTNDQEAIISAVIIRGSGTVPVLTQF